MASDSVLFEVHWTAHLTKKNKVWESGFVRWLTGNNRVVLVDEDQSCTLAECFIPGGPVMGRKYTIGAHLVEFMNPANSPVDTQPSRLSLSPKKPLISSHTSPPPAKRRLLHPTATRNTETDATSISSNSEPSSRPTALTSGVTVKKRPFQQLPFRTPARVDPKPSEREEPIPKNAKESFSIPEDLSKRYEIPTLQPTDIREPNTILKSTPMPPSNNDYVMMDWNLFEKPQAISRSTTFDQPREHSTTDIQHTNETADTFGQATTDENSDSRTADEVLSNDDFVPLSQSTRRKTYQTNGQSNDVSSIPMKRPPPPLPPRKEGATLDFSIPVKKSSFIAPPTPLPAPAPVEKSIPSISKPPTPTTKPSFEKSKKSQFSSPAPKPNLASASPSASFKSPSSQNPHEAILGFGTEHLVFPSSQTISQLPKVVKRTACISPAFSSLNDYKKQFSEAIIEDINHGILPIAKKFRQVFERHCPLSPQGQRVLTETAKRTIISQFKHVYFDCELISYALQNSKKRPRGGVNEVPAQPSVQTLFLKLPADSTNQEASSTMLKDDLWLISTNSAFSPTTGSETMFFARSAMHGKSSSVMEIKPILEGAYGSKYRAQLAKVQNGEVIVHVMHIMSISSDMCMLDTLLEMSTERMPLIPWMLSATPPNAVKPVLASSLPTKEVQAALQDYASTYQLNEDQFSVFKQAALWFDSTYQHNAIVSPFVLVHGVFGSGKSYMLVLLIMFISGLFEKMADQSADPDQAPKMRILVSAATNTAVDRLLVGLLEEGFTDFVRVGSLKRINSRVLPYSIHREKKGQHGDTEGRSSSSEAKAADKLALRDLEDMLRSRTLTRDERAMIEEQKREIESGHFERRLALVESATVVGATCIATTFPILQNAKFDLVILDECSQMPEPLSMLPASKFGSRGFVLVGDPQQLPPQLRTRPKSAELETEGLGLTWFSRLEKIGNRPILLKTQYRLHPVLSSLSNELFYGGRLLNGITPAQRAPRHAALPTLLFIDNENSHEVMVAGGSIQNHGEAKTIAKLLQQLVSTCQIEGDQIGVICLYKAQVELISDLVAQIANHPESDHLKDDLGAVQIATVDSFQGAERDIIILSTVRTADDFGYASPGGFLDSPYRMNVALTRGKHHLVIVGSAPGLHASQKWNFVLNAAKASGDRSYISGNMILSGAYFSHVAKS